MNLPNYTIINPDLDKKLVVGIYALCEPDTGVIRYVGKSFNIRQRFQEHNKPRELNEPTRKAAWVKSVHKKGFKPTLKVLVELPRFDNKAEANELLYSLEWSIITTLKAAGFDLVNGSDGGPGMTGLKFSKESRKKMSESAKKRGIDWLIKYQKTSVAPNKKLGSITLKWCSKCDCWLNIDLQPRYFRVDYARRCRDCYIKFKKRKPKIVRDYWVFENLETEKLFFFNTLDESVAYFRTFLTTYNRRSLQLARDENKPYKNMIVSKGCL